MQDVSEDRVDHYGTDVTDGNMQYWSERMNDWNLLAVGVMRAANTVPGSSAAERAFSTWNFFVGGMSSMSLSAAHKVAKAYYQINRRHLDPENEDEQKQSDDQSFYERVQMQ